MSLALYLARRLPVAAPGRAGGIATAVCGIALAVAVMLLAIAVMTGFKHEIRGLITGFESQLTVVPIATGDELPYVTDDDLKAVREMLPAEAEAVITMRQPAIVKTAADFSGVVIKATDTPGGFDFIRRHLVEGVIPDYDADSTRYHIVVSRALASLMDVKLGDKLDTYFLGGGVYRVRRLKVAGIYDTHFGDFDRQMVFASSPMLRQATAVADGEGTLIEINGLPDDDAIDACAEALTAGLNHRYYSDARLTRLVVSNIHESAALYYNWLALLDTNVIVILTLMALLASLTLVSSLFILILRRVVTIGVLKALGASNRLIRRTFILMALCILGYGLVVGDAIALAIIGLQRATGFLPLNPDAYYLDHVPMQLGVGAFLILNAAVALLAMAVLLLPSAIIATIPPSRAITYE